MQQCIKNGSFIYNLFKIFKEESFINPRDAKSLLIKSNLSKMSQSETKITITKNTKFLFNFLELC